MESPGEFLKRERELRGFTLDDLHKGTRIQKLYLEALEADDYDRLPHPTFTKGFIRSYCKFLGLDENDAVLRYDVYLREVSEKHRPAAQEKKEEPEPSTTPYTGRMVALLAAVGVVLIVAFYAWFSWRPAEVPPVPVGEEPAGVEESPLEPLPDLPGEGEPVEKAVEEAAEDQLPAAGAPGQSPAEAPPAAPAPERAEEPRPAAPRAEGAPDARPMRHTLRVNARELVWMRVTIDDREPFEVTLKEGEKATWKASESFLLVIGNAGGVDMTYDGKDLPSLGGPGEVIRLELSG